VKRKNPNLSARAPRKCSCGDTSKMHIQDLKVNPEEHLNLFEARGRYSRGPAWRIFLTATTHRDVLDLFEAEGVTSVRLIASTDGTANKGAQNSGAPTLLLLGGAAVEVEDE